MNLGKYGKAIVAALGTLSLVLADNVIDTSDTSLIIEGVLAVLTVLGVFAIKNVPQQARSPE